MRAAWYEKQGPAREVLTVGEMPDPIPSSGEVRIRIAASGISPGDIKKRQDALDQGACLGIPGITAHRAVHVAGVVTGGSVLVQGAAGAVGVCADQLARRAGARVIGTIRSSSEESIAISAGAHEVLRNDQEMPARVRALAPEGIDHIVEVAFGANIETDVELLKLGGSIATYATNTESPKIPFWQMVFKNIRLFFLGSDDFPTEAKMSAARDLNGALESGWSGFEISKRVPLEEIARAHELAEYPIRPGRLIVTL
jgi:NADPH2:quinone reductase